MINRPHPADIRRTRVLAADLLAGHARPQEEEDRTRLTFLEAEQPCPPVLVL